MSFTPITYIDVWPLSAALFKERARFSENTKRQEQPGGAHKETQSILLRGPEDADEENWFLDIKQVDYPILKNWKSAKSVLERVRKAVNNRPLGKVMIVQLRPAASVAWHVDNGPYYDAYHRLHLPLVTNPGAQMFSGLAALHIPVGHLIHIDNRVLHSAINVGQHPRIHMIIDVKKPEEE